MDEARIASIKLVTGEELLCLLVDIIEGDRFTSVLIEKPVLLTKNKSRRNPDKSYQISSWLVADDPNRQYYEINVDKIIITTVITDNEILNDYKKLFVPVLKARPKMSDKLLKSDVGYIGSVDDFRVRLEQIYNMDPYKDRENN